VRRLLLAGFVLSAACGRLALAQSGGVVTGADSSIKVFAGAEESLSDQSNPTLNPFAVVVGRAPVYFGSAHPFDFRASARFGGATGSTVDLSNIQTFRALDFDARIERSLSDSSEPTQLLYGLDGGFQDILPATPSPLTKTAKRLYAYVTLQAKSSGAITGGIGRTTESAPFTVWAGFIDARVPLQGPNGLFWLGGRAVFPIGQAFVSDSIQVFVAVATKNITVKSTAP